MQFGSYLGTVHRKLLDLQQIPSDIYSFYLVQLRRLAEESKRSMQEGSSTTPLSLIRMRMQKIQTELQAFRESLPSDMKYHCKLPAKVSPFPVDKISANYSEALTDRFTSFHVDAHPPHSHAYTHRAVGGH